MGNRINIRKGGRLLFLLAPLVIYLLHTLPLKEWVVDDAGISYVYARNLAQGYGLTAQLGLPPVEGFSNFLWVILLTPFFLLNLFDPIITPKVLGGLLITGSFFLVERTLHRITENRLAALIVLSLLAINTSFVVWSVSGLENPLYSFLTALLLYLVTVESSPISVAITSLLIALTRPDGIIFCVVYPIILLVHGLHKNRRNLLTYAAVFTVIFGAFLLFRWSYFGDLVPNTFHVKGGAGGSDIANLFLLTPDGYARVFELFYSVASYFGGILFVGLISAILFLLRSKNLKPSLFPALILTFIAIVLYALMPIDWMGEFRFATPFYIPFYVLAFAVFEELWKHFYLSQRTRNLLTFSTLVFVFVLSIATFGLRTINFASQPPVDFTVIKKVYALRFNEYASRLGITDGSILIPDLGATLYYGNLHIYDLAGLTDKTVAQVLYTDQAALHDYIFETTKPIFIHVHAGWSYLAGLDNDPRFRSDYTPIHEWIDDYVIERYGVGIYSGDYVRKDAIMGKENILDELRSEAEK